MYSFRTGEPVTDQMKLAETKLTLNDVVKTCNCEYCERRRAFDTHLDKIHDVDSKKFFQNIYDALCETEERIGLYKIYLENLKKKDISCKSKN